jgi:hypothetical protein
VVDARRDGDLRRLRQNGAMLTIDTCPCCGREVAADDQRARTGDPISLAILAAASTLAAGTLVLDAFPAWLTASFHPSVSAVPLAAAALAVLVHRLVAGGGAADVARSLLLAGAFLAWSADQVVPWSRVATACNDVAILLFVVDVALALSPRLASDRRALSEMH